MTEAFMSCGVTDVFVVLLSDCINDTDIGTDTCTAVLLLPLSVLVLCCPCTDELVRD